MPRPDRRAAHATAAFGGALLGAPGRLRAQTQPQAWPARPVTVVVPFPPGGGRTSHHLAAELFKLQTRTYITHIPYRGAGPALHELIAGQVDLMFDGLVSSAAHIKAGRLRGLAVAADTRAPGFPDLPTAAEAGVRGYDVATWCGIFAAKGTPREIVAAFQGEMRKALAGDELRATWTGLGTETPDLYGDAFARFVSAEIRRRGDVVRNSGAKLD